MIKRGGNITDHRRSGNQVNQSISYSKVSHITVLNSTEKYNVAQCIISHQLTTLYSTVQYITSHHSMVHRGTVHHTDSTVICLPSQLDIFSSEAGELILQKIQKNPFPDPTLLGVFSVSLSRHPNIDILCVIQAPIKRALQIR